ncbi:MAG: hypothetical protein ACFCGT_21730 [Sandaracinaceae bacterium]
MRGRALSPSPIARFLLGLAERRADGQVDVGGRKVLLRQGEVVEVTAAEGDGDLRAFLRDAGRVDEERLEAAAVAARRDGSSLGAALVALGVLTAEQLRPVHRALWLDRLVRGLARVAAEGREPTPLQATAQIDPDLPAVHLVPLVLDALERRAADRDAHEIEARADHRLEWIDGPALQRALRGAGFDDLGREPTGATLLRQEPAAAPRTAALVRAGLARVVPRDAPPSPGPRHAPLPRAAPSKGTPPLGSAQADRPKRRRHPSMQLDPGLAELFDPKRQIEVSLPSFPAPTTSLDDPLDALERTIASLEQADAAGAERAAAWRAFGAGWRDRFLSLEEAARAYREAVAADPEDADALVQATELCAALGQSDLAVAYARARIGIAEAGPGRSEALCAYALLCRRLGKVSEALSAIRAATAAAPGHPAPYEIGAYLWRELGRDDEASRSAAAAAERLRDTEPGRALAMRSVAHDLAPDDVQQADAYAAFLASLGLPEAGIAVRAEAVDLTRDPDQRRTLLLAAAEQAELAERPAVAARLLSRAFDAEPYLDLVYEPLDADFQAAGLTLERALLLEEIAAAAPPEQQAPWYGRAADIRLDLPSDGWWEAELRTRALELDPESETTRRALLSSAEAAADGRLYADALERAIHRGRWRSADAQAIALTELAQLTEEDLHAPMRALWAWQRLALLRPQDPAPRRQLERLAHDARRHRERRQELEDALSGRRGGEGQDLVRALADHLRDDPDRRRQALGLYRELLEADPTDASVADSMERLLRLAGDEEGHARVLVFRAEQARTKADRIRYLLRLAATSAQAGAFRDGADACRAILAEHASHREAVLRLRRAASRLGDRELLREALAREAQLPLPAEERAWTLAALGRELERAGSLDEALDCAEAALGSARSAEAALIVVRQLERVTEPGAALGVVRALFGDSPPILRAWARVAQGAGEREVMEETLAAWSAIAPYDPEPWAMGVAAFERMGTAEQLAAWGEGALADDHLVPGTARAVARAVEVLAEQGWDGAAHLALRAADAFGPHGDALRDLAARLTDGGGDLLLAVAAVERRLPGELEEERIGLLLHLASLHRRRRDRAAEARTLLRVLALEPHHKVALERLVDIYAETGEAERLSAALALELEATEGAERGDTLLRLAAAARDQQDLDRAEAFLREAAGAATAEDPEPLYASAGALVSLGRPRRAVELLREGGNKLPPPGGAEAFLRAVETAMRRVRDPRLALSTAIEGLDVVPGSGPLLVTFEHIALQLRDVGVAERTYWRLRARAMGPQGRRALSYRQGRWLERVQAPEAALEAYLAAFEVEPRGGALLAAIERLARSLNDLEALVWALQRLAETVPHPGVRTKLATRAARVLEEEMDDPARAFSVLATLWETTGAPEAEEDLGRLAARLRLSDRASADTAYTRLVGVLTERAAGAWLVDERVRLLRRAARLTALGLEDVAGAASLIEQALVAAEDADGGEDLRGDLMVELADWYAEADQPELAQGWVAQALAERPDHAGALGLAERVSPSASPHDPRPPRAHGTDRGLGPGNVEQEAAQEAPAASTPRLIGGAVAGDGPGGAEGRAGAREVAPSRDTQEAIASLPPLPPLRDDEQGGDTEPAPTPEPRGTPESGAAAGPRAAAEQAAGAEQAAAEDHVAAEPHAAAEQADEADEAAAEDHEATEPRAAPDEAAPNRAAPEPRTAREPRAAPARPLPGEPAAPEAHDAAETHEAASSGGSAPHAGPGPAPPVADMIAASEAVAQARRRATVAGPWEERRAQAEAAALTAQRAAELGRPAPPPVPADARRPTADAAGAASRRRRPTLRGTTAPTVDAEGSPETPYEMRMRAARHSQSLAPPSDGLAGVVGAVAVDDASPDGRSRSLRVESAPAMPAARATSPWGEVGPEAPGTWPEPAAGRSAAPDRDAPAAGPAAQPEPPTLAESRSAPEEPGAPGAGAPPEGAPPPRGVAVAALRPPREGRDRSAGREPGLGPDPLGDPGLGRPPTQPFRVATRSPVEADADAPAPELLPSPPPPPPAAAPAPAAAIPMELVPEDLRDLTVTEEELSAEELEKLQELLTPIDDPTVSAPPREDGAELGDDWVDEDEPTRDLEVTRRVEVAARSGNGAAHDTRRDVVAVRAPDRSPPVRDLDDARRATPAHGAPAVAATDAAPAGRPRRTSVPPPGIPWASPPAPEAPQELLERADEALAAGQPARGRDLLRSVLRTDPWRVSAVRRLLEACRLVNDLRGAHLASAYLSLIDPSVRPVGDFPHPGVDALEELFHDAAWAPVRRLWRQLWEEAGPLFRETQEEPPSPNDRVTRIAMTPEARAFALGLASLGRNDLPPFYYRRGVLEELRVVRHLPPCIVAGRRLSGTEAKLRFELGRALEALLPEHLLVVSLPGGEARVVVEAVSAAFGPASSNGRHVDKAAARLAADLWRTMSTRAQADLRSILETTERWTDLDGYRQEVERARLRSGLVASSDLAGAARALLDEARLRPMDDASLAEAVQGSPSLTELLGFAFGALLG